MSWMNRMCLSFARIKSSGDVSPMLTNVESLTFVTRKRVGDISRLRKHRQRFYNAGSIGLPCLETHLIFVVLVKNVKNLEVSQGEI